MYMHIPEEYLIHVTVVFLLLCAGTWRYIQMKILPYIIDWLFILILGVLMATLSFIIDVFIDWISKGEWGSPVPMLSGEQSGSHVEWRGGSPVPMLSGEQSGSHVDMECHHTRVCIHVHVHTHACNMQTA